MEPLDVYMTICMVAVLLALMLSEVGFFYMPIVLYGIAVICVMLTYCSCAAGRRKSRRKRKRR